MWPAMMVEITAMILLAVWTAQTNFGWKRLVLDDATGETMGQCSGDGRMVLLFLALALTLIPTLLTEIMAWKTMDVDEAFSESRWIFALILVQFQVSADCGMVPRIQLVRRSCTLTVVLQSYLARSFWWLYLWFTFCGKFRVTDGTSERV